VHLDYLNLTTGERFPLRCKANFCSWCGPINAALIAQAQGMAAPERSVRFSLVPDDWQTARLIIKQVREALADGGKRNEFAYSIERNPKGTGCHLHMVQHGDYLDQKWLQEVCQRNGLGIPYINRLRTANGPAYGLKRAGAAWYSMKATQERADLYGDFLKINGGRLSHHTRGYYRDEDGRTLTQGQAIAAVVARKHQAEPEEGTWVTVVEGRSLASARIERLRAAGSRGRVVL
jgi:hypothetical protein